jgi:hypothetical protein
MLTKRLPPFLPPLTLEEALALAVWCGVRNGRCVMSAWPGVSRPTML